MLEPRKTATPNNHEERSPSPARSSKSAQSAERHRFGLSRMKLKLGLSAETLVSPLHTPERPMHGQHNGARNSPRTPGHHHYNVLSRLQALFPSPAPHCPSRTSTGPPVLPAPNIPTLDITNDVERSLQALNLPRSSPFLKVKIVTWNHGYTLPKGDLSTLFGTVPGYEPPADGIKDTLPEFSSNHEHPYHIVVVAAQECPSQSGMPLGIGAGLRRFEIRDKEKKLEKEKEKERKLEKRRSKRSGKGRDGERESLSLQGASQSSTNPEAPGTPLPGKESPFFSSTPPSPTLPTGFPYQQMPASSAYSLKSLVSQHKATAMVEHHHIGWSSVLEDWFCNGVSSVSGAKPAIASEVSLPSTAPSDIPSNQLPRTSQAGLTELDLASPVRSPTPESAKEGNIPWLFPPPLTVDVPPNAIFNAQPQGQRGPYVLHSKERLMAIALYVFVHRDVQHLVQGTSKSTVTAGLIGGRVGNKGGVGISIKIAGTTLLFVNAHLAAHEAKQAERVANMVKIKAELDLDTFLEPNDPRTVAEDLTDRFDHTFIFGDLNFRLNVTRLHAEWLISRKDYATALCFDQLKEVMKRGEPFAGFEEAIIQFPPTFKYDVLRTLKKHRSVRDALKVRRRKNRKHHEHDGADEPEEEECSSDESSSSSDENDHQSVASSAHRSQHSRRVAEEDEDEDDSDSILAPAARNAIANAAPLKSEVHTAALRAKEKFLALVQRPPSPANTNPVTISLPPNSAETLPSVSLVTKRLKMDPSSLKPPPSPQPPFAPVVQTVQSSFEITRTSMETPKPHLRRAQSTKSGVPQIKDSGQADAASAGVYDSSSKQRVPSWCDRILYKSNVTPDPEADRVTPNRFSSIFNFKRTRKDSAQSGGSSLESPYGSALRGSIAPIKLDPPVSPTAPSIPDSPNRHSPFGRFFRQESLPNPASRSPVSPKPDRSPSLNLLAKPLDAHRSTDDSEATGNDRRRSFSTSFRASPTATRTSSLSPLEQPPTTSQTEVSVDVKKAPGPASGWRWLLHRSSGSPQDASPHALEPPVNLHHKGDVVCLKYDTLDDRQMRQLEARSDHRPVTGDFAIYV